jgi:hypothetical protein
MREVGMSSTIDPGYHWAADFSTDIDLQHSSEKQPKILNAIYDGEIGRTIFTESSGRVGTVGRHDKTHRATHFMGGSLTHLAERPPNSPRLVVADVAGTIAVVPFLDGILHGEVMTGASTWYLQTTITDLVANPFSSAESQEFALAGEDGVVINIQNRQLSRRDFPTRYGSREGVATNTLSAAYQKPQVLLWGYRDGGMAICDLRVKQEILRAKHPSPVRRMQFVDDHHFLAAGITDRLSMYDLRWCPPPTSTSEPNSSPTYLTYPEYRCSNLRGSTIDVSKSLNLIISARDHEHISLFNLWRGTERRRIQLDMLGEINAIRFATETPQDIDGSKGVGVCVIARDHQLQRWYFGRSPDR